jgi:hypothetical protein
MAMTCRIPAKVASSLPKRPRPRPRQRSKSKSHAQPARGRLPVLYIYRPDWVQACFVQNFKLGAIFHLSR